MERTHVWRKFWTAVTSALLTAMFMFFSIYADDLWTWFFMAVTFVAALSMAGDIRRFFEELDRRRDLERERRQS